MKHSPLPEADRRLMRWLLFLTLFLIGVASASAHYDPRLGRWLSRDPLGEEGGVNLYAYCGNDPVNRHDPLGLSTKLNIDGSVQFFDDPFNSHTELLEIAGLLDQRNALAAKKAKISQSPLRGYGGYTALIDRQVGGLADAIRSKDTEIKYRMTSDLTRGMGADGQAEFIRRAYGNSFNELEEFYRQQVLHGDAPAGPLFALGEATRQVEPHLAAFMGLLVTLPMGGEGAALELGSGKALATRAGARLTWSEFRSINAGRFTQSDLSVAWSQYKRGVPGNYLTREPTSFERFFFDNRNFDTVRASRGGAKGLTYEHLFIMQKSFDNSVPSVLRGLGNSGWNSGLLIDRRLNSTLGNNLGLRWLFRAGVVGSSGATAYGSYWFGSHYISPFITGEDE